MSNPLTLESTLPQLSEAAKEMAQKTTSAAKDFTGKIADVADDVSDATKSAAHRATDSVKEIYHSASAKAEGVMTTTQDYVRRNPVTFVLGSVVLGAAIGCIIMNARRKPSFSERFADEPMVSVRDAIFSALAPVSQRVHDGYDSARDGVGKVMDQVHRLRPGHGAHSLSDRISRAASNLKFW